MNAGQNGAGGIRLGSAKSAVPEQVQFKYDRADKRLFIEAVWDGITWDWDFRD
jgi:hypothetical protein